MLYLCIVFSFYTNKKYISYHTETTIFRIMNTPDNYFVIAFRLLGSLSLLIFGMKAMSDALQKMAGTGLRNILRRMTTNRFTGMLTGVAVTAAVQSSTATTVMTVSFVNAGLLTLAQAISVIMGANIGTTLTAWIMSAGFSFNITDFVWPAFIIALILVYRKSRATLGDFLFGIAFMFLGLGTLRQTGIDMNLGENEAILAFFSQFDPYSYTTTLLFLLIGGLLTMCVQSSAAVMAITMILCSSGALPIYQGIALVMGENIGTTVTSNLAALTATIQARRAAFAHMFFNIFGVIWMLFCFHPFVDMVCNMVGYDVTMTKEAVGREAFLENAAKLSIVLAAFHTCFNIANTAILIGFIPQIERIVCRVIRKKTVEGQEDFDSMERLKYIDSGVIRTPEISILQAQKEISLFAKRMHRMFGMVRDLPSTSDENFVRLYSRIEKYEGISDRMEIEIAEYLEKVANAHLSDETKSTLRSMLREVSELESIGDACFNIARQINRLEATQQKMPATLMTRIRAIMLLVDNSIVEMRRVMDAPTEEVSIDNTIEIEKSINALRNQLREQNISDINDHLYDYTIGTIYIEIINECERLGDYVVNVVEARLR